MSAPPIFGLGTRMQIQGNTVLWSVLCYGITKYKIEEVSRRLSHADSLRTLNGTF